MLENINFIEKFITNYGYLAILFFMTIESSFIPFPSEIVMIPAGYFASKGKLNLLLCVISGSLGSLIGAWINYFLALKFGRKFVKKIMPKKYFLKSENLFSKYDILAIFIGRLLPGIRQYISLPAGLFKMNFLSFSILTFLGAFLWNSSLVFFGYFFGINENLFLKFKYTTIIITLLLFTFFIFFLKAKT